MAGIKGGRVIIRLTETLRNLFPQMTPVCCAGIPACDRTGRHRHDAIDLASWDFDFHGGIQEVGRVQDQLE